MRHLLITILSFALCAGVQAQSRDGEISIREWSNDLDKLQTQVIEPLREYFTDQPCQRGLGPYASVFLEKLQTIQAEVSSFSYLLFREIALATTESLIPLEDKLTCQDTKDKWGLIEHQFEVKVRFASHILALLDVAGSL